MTALAIVQTLNGFQLGVTLFLMAAGLTLVFGIMDMINLAHGSFYMIGAYLTATFVGVFDSFLLAVLFALPLAALVGLLVEMVALRTLYQRDHLDQVLATFGLILFFNELVKIIWGPVPIFMGVPEFLSGRIMFGPDLEYPAYRLAIIVVGFLVAIGLWLMISRTRLGMLIRAGASNREMVTALGVNIKLLYSLVFALGAGLAALAGAMAGPIYSVQVGMGEQILILTFVVIVIGGIGSIRGAMVGAILVGLVDTFGRVLLPGAMFALTGSTAAQGVGSAIASMSIYILMAAVLFFRPRGLFPVKV
ncbi:branched-chain amino acid ABC transporter permease [Fodinicurvata sp. EGI_FJ10296]|uniref:branched-chain amino acid ABC transporter permease n=1 Tax=Fodinicurvata sp. EGI_FJ10296 TaxID=3231908 RepID=UPI00345187F2